MRLVVFAVAVLSITAAGSASADVSGQRQVTALVRRAVLTASVNFDSLRKRTGSNGTDQMLYDMKGMPPSRALGFCVLADRHEEHVLYCNLREFPTLQAAIAFYIPAYRRHTMLRFDARQKTMLFRVTAKRGPLTHRRASL
jgi:hypothetical protein